MKIAITADLHLTTRAEHPERYAALENILAQMLADGLITLIIAGDLFDASRQNYAEFEALCKRPEFSNINFLVVPGNHDPALSSNQIVAPNLHIFTKPEAVRLDPRGPVFFFLPYEKYKTMGERIAEFAPKLPTGDWVLIAHGDWLDGTGDPNVYESGAYMPFTRMDLETFHPGQVILGHIHAASDAGRYPINYTGSPCGLDINETGRRRFLTYDTQQRTFESRPVQTEVLFFNETLTILPLENEGAFLRHKAAMLIESWGLSPSEYSQACIRITASGYSNDRQALMDTLKDCFAGFTFFKDEGPDISAVSISNDPNRGILGEAMLSRIAAQPWPIGMDEPGQEDILLAALGIIYGGKK